MKNPYSAGFYALFAALLVVCAGLFWATLTGGRAGSTQDAFAFINSVSALAQALAAGVVAYLAYRGLTSWKQELIHSKAHGVVWDANVAFRKIESSVVRLGETWARSAPPTKADIILNALSQDPVTQQIDELTTQCLILDKVVLKANWVWAGRAKELRNALDHLAVEIHKPPRQKQGVQLGNLFSSRTQESIDKAVDRLQAAMNVIEEELRRLDLKYSA